MATRVLKSGNVLVEERTELVPITCGGCGVLFAMTSDYIADRKRDKRNWHCPNGCSRIYSKSDAEIEAERLRAALEAAEKHVMDWNAYAHDRSEQLERERKSHASTKGQLTKTRKRVQGGVCPVDGCHRHFTNLQRHMRTKHEGIEAMFLSPSPSSPQEEETR